jgi:hypothetical protein
MILNITEELPPLTKEEVSQVFINTLDLISGFSILFLQCSPAEANQLIPRVRQKLPESSAKIFVIILVIFALFLYCQNLLLGTLFVVLQIFMIGILEYLKSLTI